MRHPLTPPPGMVVRLADAFATEIREVRNLGCTLDVKTNDGALGGTAYARITPTTPKAARGLRLAAEQDGAPGRKAIGSRVYKTERGAMAFARRAADHYDKTVYVEESWQRGGGWWTSGLSSEGQLDCEVKP